MSEVCPGEIVFNSQKSAFAEAVKRGWNCFYKVFPQGRHMYGIAPATKYLANIILSRKEPERTYQELMRHGTPLATYFDIDAEYDECPTDVVATRRKLIEAIHKLLESQFKLLLREKFKSHFMRWADSSGPYKGGWKLSLHAVYTDPEIGWRFCHSSSQGAEPRKCLNEFVKLLVARSHDVDELWFLEQGEDDVVHRRSLIDIKAYSANRAMRCLGCRKYGDTRVLMPVDENYEVSAEIDKTQVRSMNTSNWVPTRLLTIAPGHALIDGDKKTIRSATLTRHWLDKVAEQCGCAIDKVKGNLITLRTIANRQCKISGETYGKEHNRCYLLLQNGKVIYKQHGVSGQCVVEEYDLQKDYEFYHDTVKLRSRAQQLGTNFTEEHVIQFAKDVVSFINVPGSPEFVVRVDKGRRTEFTNCNLPVPFKEYKILPVGDLWSGCGPVFVTYSEKTDKKTGTIVLDSNGDPEMQKQKTSLQGVVCDQASLGNLRTYNDIAWAPYCPGREHPYLGYNVFNSFGGFPLAHVKPRNAPPFEQHAVYELMRSQLTASDEASFEYLLNYLAHKLQRPNIRIDTCLCFVRTTQGIGKGQFGDWLQALFAHENVIVASNLDHVFSNFNSHLSSCLWLILEELASHGKGWENSDRLKDLISSTKQVWEQKFKTPRVGSWFGQVMVFSNHSFGLKLENTDRRHVLFDTTATRRDDKKFHDAVSAQTVDSDYMATAYEWLLNRDVSAWNWRTLPNTKTRAIVKRGCETPWMKFTRWLFEKESNFDTMCVDDFGITFRSDYVEWSGSGRDISVITYPAHLVYLFKKSREIEGFHCKLNETSVIVDSILFLWGDAVQSGGRYRTRNSKRGVRHGIKVPSVLKLQEILSKHTRSTVSFGCFDT